MLRQIYFKIIILTYIHLLQLNFIIKMTSQNIKKPGFFPKNQKIQSKRTTEKSAKNPLLWIEFESSIYKFILIPTFLLQ
jgi:hypothetical protein